MADLCIIHFGKAHLCFQGFQGMARLSMVHGCQFTLVLKDSNLYVVYSCNFLVTPEDWRLGLLINISKFPLDPDGNELTQLGLLMTNLDFLKVGLWPFIEEVLIMTPPKQMQLGVGYHNPRAVQVNRYMACICMSGESNVAYNMVWEAPMNLCVCA